jgi:class 3 adenylate cyclase
MVPRVLAFAIVGVLVLLRVPHSREGRAFFYFCVAFSFQWFLYRGNQPLQTYAWITTLFLSGCLWAPLLLRAALLLPPEAAPTGRLALAWPWVFAAFGPIVTSNMVGIPFSPEEGHRLNAGLHVVLLPTVLSVVTRNYLRSGPVGHRQLKWVVFGVYAGIAPVLFTDALGAYSRELWWLHDLAMVPIIVVPICVFLAIVLFNLYDIDRLITAAGYYSALLILILAGSFAIVPPAAAVVSDLLGVEPVVVQSGLTLFLAGAVVWGTRDLRPRVERFFLPERHRLEEGIGDLLVQIARCRKPDVVFASLCDRLDALLSPARCAIFVRDRGAFHRVYARGSAAPAAFSAESDLIALLEAHSSPANVDSEWLRGSRDELDPIDAGDLARLGVAVLLPIRRVGQLSAFVMLGRKRSGDVFTSGDLALLETLAVGAESALLRIGLEEYVPGMIREALETGDRLEAHERRVSILFVDIHGHSAWARTRDPQTVFDMVGQFTETGAEIIRRHGGVVTEFTGDGIMAIYGASGAGTGKESAAVESGCEIVRAIAERTLGAEAGGEQALAVGVGIATGQATVGPVSIGENRIWTAIGNTANLAARLEGLTRLLDAQVVLDAPTWSGAGQSALAFKPQPMQAVRDHGDVDLYFLPRK